MMAAVTTNAAVTAMRSASVRRKASSGDISIRRPGERRDPSPQTFVFREGGRTAVLIQRARGMGPGAPRDDDRSHPLHLHRNLWPVPDGLIYHAIALGQLQQQIEL